MGGESIQTVRLTITSAAAWAEKAQPGAALCYAAGFTCAETAEEVREYLRLMVAQGYVYLKQRRRLRDGVRDGFHYLMERSSRPWGKPLKVAR